MSDQIGEKRDEIGLFGQHSHRELDYSIRYGLEKKKRVMVLNQDGKWHTYENYEDYEREKEIYTGRGRKQKI